ncbi:MAG: hypothetical protein ABIJ34_03805 [archaeon]
MRENNFEKVNDSLERLEVLSDIYNDFAKREYSSKSELDIAKLKMKLVKKEILLLNYRISKDISE